MTFEQVQQEIKARYPAERIIISKHNLIIARTGPKYIVYHLTNHAGKAVNTITYYSSLEQLMKEWL